MRHDSRLSRVLHALLHLDRMGEPATSERIATMLDTNASVVRRTMAGLREREYVRSAKGHGGGWELARPLAEITLLDVYDALGAPELFAVGAALDAPRCPLEKAANAALARALARAGEAFRAELGRATMADLAEGIPRDPDCAG
jgi:Rrf2 family protein